MCPHFHTPVNRQRGFTLVELIMVIVIMGVIGGVVAVFMRAPIDAYFDSARRAALTDVADTAVRRMARDVRKALPNSIRVPSATCLEFIPTRTGGRYRTVDAAAGTALDFTVADTQFNMLGRNSLLPADQQIQPGDVVAVYNLGIPGASAYAQENTAVIAAGGVVDGGVETAITIAARQFPLESGSNRFHVIPTEERVVAYVCTGNTLRRTVTTGSFTSACPATGPILATNVQSCAFVYNGSDLQRNGLVQIDLRISSNNETVSLYHEVHVNNSP
ncbi:MAG: type II secretion system protein [Rhodoferax sp.]|nr:type II secretion system protein [Rhodoferax sp.]